MIMKISFNNEEFYYKAYIKAAQYLALLRTLQNLRIQLKEILRTFFKVDLSAFFECTTDGMILKHQQSLSNIQSFQKTEKFERTLNLVLESGFIALELVGTPNPNALLFLPISKEDQIIGVLLIGYQSSEPLPKYLINIFIAFAGLIGITIENLSMTETLHRERDNFKTILEFMLDGVYLVDQQNNIEFINTVIENEFGAVNGRKCYEYFHDRVEICPWCKNQEVFAGKIVRWEWRSFKNQRIYELIGTPFKNLDGSISGLQIFRDVTERKLADEKLKKAFEELMEIDRLKDEFYEDASHELRTPLIAIKGFAEILIKSPELNENLRDDVETVLRNELRLETLILGMLDYSRLKSGKVQFEKDQFRVSEILTELKQEQDLLIKKKQLSIEEIFDPDIELVLDKYQIKKVIENLFTNTIKFSFAGGKILITSSIKNGLWTFSVRDYGIGIPKEEIPKLFTRFHRLKNSEGMRANGLGLGLAICKKIVNFYDGKIWAESAGLNKGTTITFQIDLPKQ